MSIDFTERTATPAAHRDAQLRPGFATDAVHAGQAPDPLTGAVVPPIYQTSTFTQDGVEALKNGYEYSRGGNPTRNGFETQLAALEGGGAGFAFASGIAAEDAVLRAVLKPGDTVIAAAETYGGTHRLLTQIYARWGVRTVFVHPERPAELQDAFAAEPQAKLLWLETPTNPLLTVVDIAAWSRIAHDHGALSIVDNTFASPALQTPLRLGADVVVHSTTKYIGGHSDVLGGAVITGEAVWQGQPLEELIGFQQFAAGAVAGPQDSFLAARGLKTLGVRIRQHCENAAAVADWLTEHPQVAEVYYPGLRQHSTHGIAAAQMSGYGGLVTFRLRGGEYAARRTAESTGLFGLSVSLGGVESLISHPATMTHGSTKGTPQAPSADIVRLSVGIEDVNHLIDDLERALTEH